MPDGSGQLELHDVGVAGERILAAIDALRAEVRELRAELRRGRSGAEQLIAAIEEAFGSGRFTSAGLLTLAEEDPHGELADALAAAIDIDATPRGRATALGALLARHVDVQIVAEQRGCTVYRLRT